MNQPEFIIAAMCGVVIGLIVGWVVFGDCRRELERYKNQATQLRLDADLAVTELNLLKHKYDDQQQTRTNLKELEHELLNTLTIDDFPELTT